MQYCIDWDMPCSWAGCGACICSIGSIGGIMACPWEAQTWMNSGKPRSIGIPKIAPTKYAVSGPSLEQGGEWVAHAYSERKKHRVKP